MKKIFFSIVALAALAACSKSEVAYEAPKEIGFTPVKGNVTKASGLSGELAATQHLGVWAYWDKTVEVDDEGTVTEPTYGSYTDDYLVNALFQKKTVNNVSAWGGAGNGYPWPVNGALVFAGYTTPTDNVITLDDNDDETNGTEVSYSLVDDTMIIRNYENDDEFDLCWFGRTAQAYNYRTNDGAIPVTLSHALTWISIQVQASGSPVGWKITSMSLDDLTVKGTATCKATTATWDSVETDDLNIYEPAEEEDPYVLTTELVKLTDNIVIPSQPVDLTVNYSFMVNGVEKTDAKTVSLKLNSGNTIDWANGVHYTYTLLFEGNEILVSPSRDDWSEPTETPEVPVE